MPGTLLAEMRAADAGAADQDGAVVGARLDLAGDAVGEVGVELLGLGRGLAHLRDLEAVLQVLGEGVGERLRRCRRRLRSSWRASVLIGFAMMMDLSWASLKGRDHTLQDVDIACRRPGGTADEEAVDVWLCDQPSAALPGLTLPP